MTTNYFVTEADIEIEGEMVPHTSDANNVTILIDGNEYFRAILAEIDQLLSDKRSGIGGGFFYFHNWLLGLEAFSNDYSTDLFGVPSTWKTTPTSSDAFRFDDGSGGHPLFLDKITELQTNGVDVRGMGWISPFQISHQSGMFHEEVVAAQWKTNLLTLKSIQALRAIAGLENKIVMNVKGNARGAMHMKMVVSGNSNRLSGFVSGLDFQSGRISNSTHIPPGNKWHDAGAKVSGKAAKALFDTYKEMWNANVNSFPTPILLKDSSGVSNVLSHVADKMLFPSQNWLPEALSYDPGVKTPLITQVIDEGTDTRLSVGGKEYVQVLRTYPPGSFDQYSDGVFEFRAAIKKAIAEANQYIYVEDQGLWSWEMMSWINQRLLAQPALKVIMILGKDPDDPQNNLFRGAINDCLIKNLDSTAFGRIALYGVTAQTMHGKIVVIDDYWASIGSANFFQRSMYTDGELSISVATNDADITKSIAFKLRTRLTFEHCSHAPDASIDVLGDWYKIWRTSWGGPHASLTLQSKFKRFTLPIPFPSSPPIGMPPDSLGGVQVPLKEHYFVDTDLFHEELYEPYSDWIDLMRKQDPVVRCK